MQAQATDELESPFDIDLNNEKIDEDLNIPSHISKDFGGLFCKNGFLAENNKRRTVSNNLWIYN